MQRFLRHLLLLTVFFHTVGTMPWHEAQHLRDAFSNAEQRWVAVDDFVEDGATNAEDEEAHGLCSWCLASALHATTAPNPAFTWRATALATTAPRVDLDTPRQTSQQYWSAQPRAPPALV